MSLVKFNSRSLMPSWSDFFSDDKFFNSNSQFAPAANIEELDNSFEVRMAIPGMDKKDINVELDGNILTISSNKETTEEDKQKNYMRKEYSYSSFARSFTLPENIKVEAINAGYENGELVVNMPKQEVSVSKSKLIEVA